MILALELHFANPGQEEPIRRLRLAASDQRTRLGIPRGNVLWLAKGTPALPCVIWACPFADAKAHEEDMWTRHFSREFEAARGALRGHCERVERALYALEDGNANAIAAPWVWQCWWSVPQQFEGMLLDSLKEAAAQAQEPGTRGDAILRREDGSKSLPYVICTAGFQERQRAFTALDESSGGDASATANPLKPAYSLWERLD